MRKLKNRRIPNGTYGGVRGRRAEARLLLDGRRLSNRGCAANGILMTLSRKRGNDAAGGSLPKRELSTGLRDGDGIAAGWLPRPRSRSRPRSQQGGCIWPEGRRGVEKTCIPDHEKDFSTHRSCSDFDGILMQNTTTARNDGNRLASVRPVGGVWIVTFGAKTSDGQTVRRQTGSALRRFQWLTSVAFGATSFPRKEAIQPRLRRK